jgi:uncharacterized iron-regulated membrane protein
LRSSAITYRTIWRWHFYAGVFSIPFILWLSTTGAIYLFRPQIETWLDRPYDHLAIGSVHATPVEQVEAALRAVPGTNFHYWAMSRRADSASQIVIGKAYKEYRVYLNPATLQILKIDNEDKRPMNVLFYLHGELLLGDRGSNIVELAASWAIVLLLTGVYLWWPRQSQRLAGVLYIRLHQGSRIFWRDLHAVTGILIVWYALFILLTDLPWASFWGGYLTKAKSLAATHLVQQDWGTGKGFEIQQRVQRDANSMAGMQMFGATASAMSASDVSLEPLNRLVPRAQELHLAWPVQVAPTDSPNGLWTVRTDTQNRPLRTTLYFDPTTGAIVKQEPFSQQPLVDRLINICIAMHEGQLFGWISQMLGLTAALGLITLSISAIVMWWRRRKVGVLGAPLPIGKPRWSFALVTAVLALAIYLPEMAISLAMILLLERMVFSRMPAVRRWLGLA